MVEENFQIYGVQITGKCICKSKKMNLFIFTHANLAKLSPIFISSPQDRRKLPIPLKQRFLKIYFPQQKGGGEGGESGGNYEKTERMTKIKLVRYWSQGLVNFTNFTFFTFLVINLLYHNLYSSMLKCEGSLTK